MTALKKLYRLRIADSGASTVAGNVDWETTTLIEEVSAIGGQRVEPKDATTSARPWTIRLVDAEEFVTAKLANASGRAQMLRRLGDVSVSTDGGSSYTVQATARVDAVEMAGVSSFDITFTDERLIERSTTIFVGENTTRLAPSGLASPWYNYQPVGAFRFVVTDVDATNNRTEYDAIGETRPVLNPGGLAVSDDALTLMRDDFSLLRAEIDGTDRTVFDIQGSGAAPNPIRNLESMDNPAVFRFRVSGYQDPGGVGQIRDVYFHMPTRDPNRSVPLHIGGQAGIDPFQHAKNIYDGNHQGSGDVATVRYSSDHFSAYDPSTNPEGLIGRSPRIYPRITSQETMAAHLAREVYQPNGVAPLINAAGEVAPVRIRQPDIVAISDPDNLFEFNAANSSVLPSWRNEGRDQVTVVNVTYDYVRSASRQDDRPALDGFVEVTRTVTEEADNADVVRVAHNMSVASVQSLSRQNGQAAQVSTDLFGSFGDGPVYVALKGMSATSAVTQGQRVVIDFDGLYPALQNQSRSGKRIAQVMSKTIVPDGYEFEMIELGPNSQPLGTPTVSAVANSDDPHNSIDVTVSSLPTGAGYELHIAENATEPAEGSDEWQYRIVRGTGDETVTVDRVPSGSKLWARVRATQKDRISSDWSTADDADTTALTAPSGLTEGTVTGDTAAYTWTVGESDRNILVDLDGDFVALLVAGSTGYTYEGLDPSTSYTAGIRHVDDYGGESTRVTDGFTTGGTAGTLLVPNAVTILVGGAP